MESAKDLIAEDLALSGLTTTDLNTRPLENPERAATNTPHSTQGYVIPYYTMYGKPLPFYRVKLFDHDPKYKQPKDTPNHVYFPKGFSGLLQTNRYVILTEGEKKAALATKLGFPTCALGGVDSWRNRILSVSGDSELNQQKNQLQVKIPAGAEVLEDYMSPLAIGLQELIDVLIQQDKHLIIVFDSDTTEGVKTQVQRAAAQLAFELRFRGLAFDHIRQLILPAFKGAGDKVGLDDFLIQPKHKEKFAQLVQETLAKRSAFPRHPAIRDFINRRLMRAKMSRKETQQVAMAILSDLDANGLRLRSTQELQSYYFDFTTRKLLKAQFSTDMEDNSGSPFGQFMYKRYGLSAADQRLNVWVAAQFTGEDPVDEVTPFRVLARPHINDDKVIYQLSDSQYITVQAKAPQEEPTLPGLEVFDNGENGILFESEQVKGLNIDRLLTAYAQQAQEPLTPWWADVLSQVRLKDKDKGRIILTLLFYLSPWLYRWRGMQLPVEMILGEAGSGKSTLCELRLNILKGEASLKNAPQDMKDWNASVANTGGLHITDNVQMSDKNLRQKLSDEICRLVTEPSPTIEMRKYYTNAELMKVPVRTVFGITAIQQPFLNQDIIQRSIIVELDKAQDMINHRLSYDSNWMQQQLTRFGGRESWIAHHLLVLHRFFKAVQQPQGWNYRYAAKHRLINFEQAMCVMAKVFGIDPSWIPDFLVGITERAVTEADWAFEGLQSFADYARSNGLAQKPFYASDIVNWAMQHTEYDQCEVLVNARRLGRYMKTHKGMIHTVCGIEEAGTTANRLKYRIVPSNSS